MCKSKVKVRERYVEYDMLTTISGVFISGRHNNKTNHNIGKLLHGVQKKELLIEVSIRFDGKIISYHNMI